MGELNQNGIWADMREALDWRDLIHFSILPNARSIAVKHPKFLAEWENLWRFILVINETGSRTDSRNEKKEAGFVSETCKFKRL